MTPISRLKDYSGPALFSYGFRPFFLLGAGYAGLAIALWLPFFYGALAIPTVFSPRDWHVHEMLYGYLAATVAGFLLTAIPNWTGRLPLQGWPLIGLVALWIAGRIVVCCSAEIGWCVAAVIDASFLFVVAGAAVREIAAGRNWGNIKVLIPICVLGFGNAVFHLEAHVFGSADYSVRIGVAAMVALILLIGGRIIPSFTRNWLVKQQPGRLPVAFNRFDAAVILVSAISLLPWIAVPTGMPTSIAFVLCGSLQIIRLARWAGDRTWRNPLLLILHLGYSFVPAGFLVGALAAQDDSLRSAAFHAWMTGAAGTMTLAVMTRASLGHTGRELRASNATLFIYCAVLVAALSRICAAIHPAFDPALLPLAGAAWTLAFVGFGLAYLPILCRARLV
jgi:uncharacterized protein involved in response to NO